MRSGGNSGGFKQMSQNLIHWQEQRWTSGSLEAGKVFYGSAGTLKTARCGHEPVSGICGSGLGRHKASPCRQYKSLKTQAERRIASGFYWRAAGVGHSTNRVLTHGQNGRV